MLRRVVGDDVDAFRDEVKGESIGRVLCRSGRELDTVDSFILAVIHIRGIFTEIVLFPLGQSSPARSLCARGDAGCRKAWAVGEGREDEALGFGVCLGRPGACQDVVDGRGFELFGRHGVGKTVGGEEVKEDSRELAGPTALGEEDGVVIGDGKEVSKIGYGIVGVP